MSILYTNNNVISNISSITHTVDTGTVTSETALSNIAKRSILGGYQFTCTDSATHTIEITFDELMGIDAVSLLGWSGVGSLQNLEIEVKNNSDTTIGTLNEAGVDTSRRRYISETNLTDWIWDVNFSINPVKKFVITFDTSSGISARLGILGGWNETELQIKPSSLNYKFESQGIKQRTTGGQIVASKNNSYMQSSFTTTATKETDVVDKYFNINYQSSISEPLIFIAQQDENIMLYGTQQKPNSTRCLLAKDGVEWLYETSFSIEEEL